MSTPDWTSILASIDDAIKPPLELQDAFDAMVELRDEINERISALQADLVRTSCSGRRP